MPTVRSKALRAGVAAAALLAVAGVPAIAAAASTAPATSSAAPAPREDRAAPRLAALASALGVTPEALKAAMEQARTAVPAPGRDATRAQREAAHQQYLVALAGALHIDVATLQAKMSAAVEKRDGHERKPNHRLEAVARALNVTPEALKAAMEQARTAVPEPGRDATKEARAAAQQQYLAALAAALNVDVTALQTALRGAEARRERPAPNVAEARAKIAARLASLVEDGKLTQVQADAILAKVDAAGAAGIAGGLQSLLPRDTAKADARAAAEAARTEARARAAAALAEVRATMATRLAALVVEGKLTQQQADRILAALDDAGPKVATPANTSGARGGTIALKAEQQAEKAQQRAEQARQKAADRAARGR